MSDSAPSHTDQLIRKLGKWTESISTPEFHQFKRQQLSYAIADDFDRKHFEKEPPTEFVFSKTVEKQHALVMSFYELLGSSNALAQCEYYFRRFPFRGLPVSREHHIKNMCELYFAHFYIIKNRVKTVFEKFKDACPGIKGDFGAFIKRYDKEFDQELRARNEVHHHYSFDDLNIHRIMLTGMMSSTDWYKGKGWDREHLRAYRAASKEWSDRVKRRSVVMQKFVDAVSKLILNNAPFLAD